MDSPRHHLPRESALPEIGKLGSGAARLFLLASWLLAPQMAQAKPRLLAITPYVWHQGEELEVLFRGEQLATVHQLLDYQQGITVHEWNADDPKFVKAKISVAEDCPLGPHALRLLTKEGITELRLAHVSPFLRVKESERPTSQQAPQAIPRQCTVVGRRDGRTDDWYSIEATAGERISLELVAIRLGRAAFDAKLTALGPNGEQIAEVDDTLLYQQDPMLSFIAAKAGTYLVCVASASGESNREYFYALHVGSFPRPHRVTPSGGQPGALIDLTWQQPDGTTLQQSVQLPSADAIASHHDRVFHVHPESNGKRAPSPVPIWLTKSTPTTEQEPNNTYTQATRVTVPSSIQADMNQPLDRDCFVFTAKQGEKLTARIQARKSIRSKLDADVSLRHGDGKFITSNDDQPDGPDSYLEFDIPADGDYLLVVRDQQNRGGAAFGYWLELERAQPHVTINLPEINRNESLTLAVPRGSRMALRATATKKFVNGPLQFHLDHLPTGLTLEPTSLPPDRPAATLMVSAADDAPLGGAIAPLTGTLTANEKTVPAHLFQKQLLIAGRNNFYMFGYEDSRLAVAVVEAAPFDIELIAPNVPIVRSGSMDLKIVATRQENFSAPINIRLLDNPPGITTRGRVTIPADKHEISLPATANKNAALGESRIVAIASASVGGIDYQLASPMVSLNVAEPLVAVTFPKCKVSRGQSAELVVGLECIETFDGEAKVELLGLPAGVTCEPIHVAHGATELKFEVVASEKARLGRAGGLVCKITIWQNEEPIVHMLGTGRLRVDPPSTPAPTGTQASTPS